MKPYSQNSRRTKTTALPPVFRRIPRAEQLAARRALNRVAAALRKAFAERAPANDNASGSRKKVA